MKVGFSLTGQEKTHVQLHGQVNFDLGQMKIAVWSPSQFRSQTGQG